MAILLIRVYQLLPFQILSLTEYITETVKLRAVLKGVEKLSLIMFAPVELISGAVHQETTYNSCAFNYGEKSRLKITMTGGPAARALACDYGAGIM